MKSNRSLVVDAKRAFTLVEVLVSSVLIVFLMGLLLSTVSQTQRMTSRTTAKVKEFQAARAAFDSMTRRLSQATLNTYYRAYDSDSTIERSIFTFTREAELHFLSAPATGPGGSNPGVFTSPAIANLNDPPESCYPTHAVFFQAPLGLTTERDPTVPAAAVPRFRDIDQALVGTGYFIEFGSDPSVPSFLRTLKYPDKKRFRLMELNVPTERLTIFRRPLDKTNASRLYKNEPQILDQSGTKDYVGIVDATRTTTSGWVRPLWMSDKDGALMRQSIPSSEPAAYRFTNAQPLADNVVALVILPKVAPHDRKRPEALDDLAPTYRYDSWRIIRQDPKNPQLAARDDQLPPIVQVTMVVIDEPSAALLDAKYSGKPTEWTKDLFKKVSDEDSYLADIKLMEDQIAKEHLPINYRIFTTDVVIRGSKWSKDAFQ